MKKYRVYTEYTFAGYYDIIAESKDEARRMVTELCGLVMGGNIHTTLDDEEVTNWDFNTHPETNIKEVAVRRIIKRKEDEV